MNTELLSVLCCPEDEGSLEYLHESVRCESCGRRYPIIDGVISFLADVELSELDQREQRNRDDEAEWYDSLWPQYIDKLELPAHADPLASATGPVLDIGCGPGRVSEYLAGQLGLSTIALDYSLESLRLLAKRCEGLTVLAVHGDARALPIRSNSIHGATSAQCYEHLRKDDRYALLTDVARVLQPKRPFVVSTFNYNLTFRLWKLRGNTGAREGDHMFGSDYYYVRQTRREFGEELGAVFSNVRIHPIRNIPARTIAGILARVARPSFGEAFMRWMTRSGYRVDRALSRTPLGPVCGFLLLGTVSQGN